MLFEPSSGEAEGRRHVTLRVAVWVGILGLAGLGCATPRAASKDDYTPAIAISPGVAGRLALMDRYRLHDEDRKHMMERPHVWVEEAPEDEEPEAPPAPPAEAEAPPPPR
jgi:hypothetical protein